MDAAQNPDRRRFLSAALGFIAATAVTVTTTNAIAATPANRLERQRIMRLVANEARDLGVPVALALAIAHAESDFDPFARSHKGARGVMQVMPATARGEYGIAAHLLWDPRINVRLGLHFMKRLLNRYRGRVDLALSYYNGGSAVGDLPRARVIPATRNYVRKVQRLRQNYRRDRGPGDDYRGYRVAGRSGT